MLQLLLVELELLEVEIVIDIMLLEDEVDLVGSVVETDETDTITIETLTILDDEIDETDIFVVEVMDENEDLEEMDEIVIAELEGMVETHLVLLDEDEEIVYDEMVELEEALETELTISDEKLVEMVDAQCIEMVELDEVEVSEIVSDEKVDIDEMFYEDNIDQFSQVEHYITVVLYDVDELVELEDILLNIDTLLDTSNMEEIDEMVELEQMLKCFMKRQYLLELFVINDDVVEQLELLEAETIIDETLDVMVEIDNQKFVTIRMYNYVLIT